MKKFFTSTRAGILRKRKYFSRYLFIIFLYKVCTSLLFQLFILFISLFCVWENFK